MINILTGETPTSLDLKALYLKNTSAEEALKKTLATKWVYDYEFKD